MRAALGDAVRDSVIAYERADDLSSTALRIVEVLTRLRDDPALRFVSFIDICGADYPGRERRFDVVYHLLSPYRTAASASRSRPTRTTPVPSVDRRLPGRELVRARGLRPLRHPVLGPPGSPPHPHRLRLRGPSAEEGLPAHRLRRGPLRRGAGRVIYEPVKLQQEFRNFDFLSPWEGTRLRPSRRREEAKA